MDRISFIREQERNYHERFYDSHVLFEEDSWLHKPVKTVLDLMSQISKNEDITVLDLGCGVGRNSIPIAKSISSKKNSKVICVDILETAIHQLKEYSKQYNVSSLIEPHVSDLFDYVINPNTFDYIVAVSSLEHVHSQVALDKVLSDMVNGTKIAGINCIIMNANSQEFDAGTGEMLEPLIEVNLSVEQVMHKLQKVYKGWERLMEIVKPLSFEINRDEKKVILKTQAITFVARKN